MRSPQRGWGSHLWLPVAIPGRRTHYAIRVGRSPFHGPGFWTRCGRFIDAGRASAGSRADCRNCA